MENASKALIMAGSVLIALMIIGALMLMFNNLSSYQEVNVQGTRDAQIIEFNNQYETYNRTDVRGSDLYSLLNRAVDYNRRNSTLGTEGQEIGYTPITIVFSFNGNVSQLAPPEGSNQLITKNQYTQSGTDNEFEDQIADEINRLENEYGSASLTNLTTSLTKIFINTDDLTQQQLAVDAFNTASKIKKISSFREIRQGSTIRQDVYKYYEYIQFKRAYFDCTSLERVGESGVTYDQNTGRIIKMEFKFNGKFN